MSFTWGAFLQGAVGCCSLGTPHTIVGDPLPAASSDRPSVVTSVLSGTWWL